MILGVDALSPVQDVEGPIDDGETDFVEQAEDEGDNPPCRQDGDDGRHSCEEGLDRFTNARVTCFPGLANVVFGILWHLTGRTCAGLSGLTTPGFSMTGMKECVTVPRRQ